MVGAVTGDRDDRGNFVLRQALTQQEREPLQKRADVLAKWLVPGHNGEKARRINQMLIGFGAKGSSENEQAITVTQYVSALNDVPVWAIDRACSRFERSEVKDDELGPKQTWNRSWGPSTAHLRCIAIAILRPFGEESTRLWMTLRGKPARVIDPVERARVGEKLAAFAEEFKNGHDVNVDQDLKEIAERSSLSRTEGYRRSVLGEYAHRGLQPVFNKDGSPVSISMLLSLGYTIKTDEAGAPTLVKPPYQPPSPPRGLYGEKSVETKPAKKTSARSVADLAKDILR